MNFVDKLIANNQPTHSTEKLGAGLYRITAKQSADHVVSLAIFQRFIECIDANDGSGYHIVRQGSIGTANGEWHDPILIRLEAND